MKKLYLLIILALGITAAKAQTRSVDMALILTYPTGGLVVVSENEIPVKQAEAWQNNDVGIELKNLGPDDIYPSDSAIVGLPDYNEFLPLSLSPLSSNIEPTVSIYKAWEKIPLTYEPASLTSSQITIAQACDTLWMVDANGDVLFDPDLSNNHTCNNITFHGWFLDVADVNSTNGFSLYPNPAATTLNLVSTFNNAKNATVVIRDVVGKTVFTQNLGTNLNGRQSFILDISNFVTGMYVIDLNVDGKRVTRQIQVQK